MTESVDAVNGGLIVRLHRLAVNLVLDKPFIVDEAIALACDLVVAKTDTPSTIEVAALYRGTTLADSNPLLRTMLKEHGIEIPGFAMDEEQFAARRRAFGFWGLSLSDFELPFYEQIAEWHLQGPFDRAIVMLLDKRDHETKPARRDEIEEQMRQVVRGADAG